MAERSSISQVVQLGVESTPGTPVAATKRLRSLSIEPTPSMEFSTFRPMGQKYQALSILGKEMATASISGRAVFDEIVYPLASVLDTPTITPGADTGYSWHFAPSSTDEDAPETFTIEQGSSVRAHRFAYGLVNEFGFTINRDAFELSGSMMGYAIEDGVALTTSPAPTLLPLVPILPQNVCVYVDDTFASIGTTKLGRLLNLEWTVSDRYGPLWTIDCEEDSFVTHVETEPSMTATIMVEADAAGMAFLADARNGETKYFRIHAHGPAIGAGTDEYEFTMNLAGKISDTGGFSDQDGVYAIEWSFVAVHDADIGGPMDVTVVNSLAAL